MSAADKLLNYVTFDTQSDENSETMPSTENNESSPARLSRNARRLEWTR